MFTRAHTHMHRRSRTPHDRLQPLRRFYEKRPAARVLPWLLAAVPGVLQRRWCDAACVRASAWVCSSKRGGKPSSEASCAAGCSSHFSSDLQSMQEGTPNAGWTWCPICKGEESLSRISCLMSEISAQSGPLKSHPRQKTFCYLAVPHAGLVSRGYSLLGLYRVRNEYAGLRQSGAVTSSGFGAYVPYRLLLLLLPRSFAILPTIYLANNPLGHVCGHG